MGRQNREIVGIEGGELERLHGTTVIW
jgi:hypothetical protein